MAILGCVLALALAGARDARASAQSEIAEAQGQGLAVFVVVGEGTGPATEKALEVARRAETLVGKARVVLLDRLRAENAELVKAYGVLGAPVPLILVAASNGVVAGGAPLASATPEALVALVPTPRKAEMLLAMTRKTPVFVVASRKDMPTRSAVFEALTQAFEALERKSATILVDLDDAAEKAFLKELGADPKATAPLVVVYNAKAQKTAAFRGPVTAQQLVEATKQKAPCCPGGSC